MLKVLADRLAEAFAERLHERVRREFWGYAPDERLTSAELIAEAYRGIRPAPGYPACPDHTGQGAALRLLEAERNADMRLTESYAMLAACRGVRVLPFASRRRLTLRSARSAATRSRTTRAAAALSVAEAEKWLAPNLAYELAECAPL